MEYGGKATAASIPKAVAGGTVDAITADFTPNLTLADQTLCVIVALGANVTITPTFAPDGLPAHVITKQGGTALVAGDIPGALAGCILEYNLANTRWELLNPKATAYVHPNHSGDVTSTGDGATAITNEAVSNAKLAHMATKTIKGRVTAEAGVSEDLTPIQAFAVILNPGIYAHGNMGSTETFDFTAYIRHSGTADADVVVTLNDPGFPCTCYLFITKDATDTARAISYKKTDGGDFAAGNFEWIRDDALASLAVNGGLYEIVLQRMEVADKWIPSYGTVGF